jgi:CubicO group peptidase (beta-lactamase class C family)
MEIRSSGTPCRRPPCTSAVGFEALAALARLERVIQQRRDRHRTDATGNRRDPRGALLGGGELGGVRLIGPKTLALMTSNHLPGGRDLPEMSRSLFSEAAYNGIGFGLGFSVTMNPAQTLIPGSTGEYAWGGAATTSFWIDPAEELIAIFMTQVLPSSAYPLRRELRTMVYSAITDSNL